MPTPTLLYYEFHDSTLTHVELAGNQLRLNFRRLAMRTEDWTDCFVDATMVLDVRESNEDLLEFLKLELPCRLGGEDVVDRGGNVVDPIWSVTNPAMEVSQVTLRAQWTSRVYAIAVDRISVAPLFGGKELDGR